MSIKSLIYYPTENYAGAGVGIAHGQTGDIATGYDHWTYRSVAVSAMQSFVFSEVNTDVALSYLSHVEDVISAGIPDLTQVYASSDQFPLHYLGLDPTVAALVWLKIDPSQVVPNAVASQAIVGGSSTTVTTLSLPGRPGALGFVPLTEGGAVSATCPYGSYNTATGAVSWTGSGGVELVFSAGAITIVSSIGFPQGWTFSVPQLQGDGSWVVTLDGSSPSVNMISSLTSDKQNIANNGSDTATLTAVVTDSITMQPVPDQSVNWSTTLGEIVVVSQYTDSKGQSVATLMDTGDTGTATVTASLASEAGVSLDIKVANSSALIVRGARSCQKASGQQTLGCLVALDGQSFEVVDATWQYVNEGSGRSGTSFLDTQSSDLLKVSASGYPDVVLNASNLTGNGEWTDTSTSAGAFVATLNNGECLAWGVAASGGVTPSGQGSNGIKSVSATFSAFTGVRADNSVICWGDREEGGDLPDPIAVLNSIEYVRGSTGTFAALSADNPYVLTWGWGTEGFRETDMSVPPDIAGMNSIATLISNDNAFAVLDTSGRIYTWGEATSGGTVSSEVKALTGIQTCCASRRAFAVIANGRIKAWGDSDYGSNAQSVSGITNASRLIATESAYTAILSSGKIVCWGNSTYGNDLPESYKALTGIIDVKSTYGAFAALRENGSVVTWGNSNYGGNSLSVSSRLNNIVAISATSGSFAALTSQGNVVTWGDSSTGGDDSSCAAELKDICAIYSNTHAFAALRSDNNVIVWGDPSSGVNNFPSGLNGNISYVSQ